MVGNAGFAGGLAQGIGSGVQLADTIKGRQQQQQLIDLRTQAQEAEEELQLKDLKLKQDKLKFEQLKRTKQNEFRTKFFEELGSRADFGNREQQIRTILAQQGGPTVEAAQQLQQAPAAPDSAERFARLQQLAVGGDLQDELKTLVAQGVIPTPTSTQKSQQAALKFRRESLGFETEAQESAATQKLTLGFTKRAQQTGKPNDVRAAQLAQTGDIAGAIDTAHPNAKNLSDNELIRRFVNGDREATEMLLVKQDLKPKKDGTITSTTVNPDGTVTSTVSIGGGKQQDPVIIRKQVEDIAGIDTLNGVFDEMLSLLESPEGEVGFIANAKLLATNLKSQFVGMVFEGPKAKKIQQDLFNLDIENISSIKALTPIVNAMIMRKILDERGVATEGDIQRGTEGSGLTAGFFSTANRFDVINRIGTQRKLLNKRRATIINKSKIYRDLVGEDAKPGSSFFSDMVNKNLGRTPAARKQAPVVPKQTATTPSITPQNVQQLDPDELDRRIRALQGGG